MSSGDLHGGRQDKDLRPNHGTPPTYPSSINATASRGEALSASVIATLVDAHGYEADDTSRDISHDGEILPANSKKKQFPRGMKRLRDRLQILDDRLRLDVNALKQQISDLQLHRSLLSTKIHVKETHTRTTSTSLREKAVETVVEYFKAFQFGWVLPPDFGGDDSVAGFNTSLASDHAFIHSVNEESKRAVGHPRQDVALQRERQESLMDHQHKFVTAKLEPSMQLAGQKDGVAVLVQQWKTFTKHHDQSRLELTSMSCHGPVDEPIVVAMGLWSGSIIQGQLHELYPAVATDPVLKHRLVSTLIQYPSREIFHFDFEGRVIHYDSELDLVCAFQRAIGTLRNVERLLGRYATLSGYWVERQWDSSTENVDESAV